jgi:hypothetical protein
MDNADKEQPRLYDIDGVEIFQAGRWNGDEYTENDLNDIVKSYEEIGERIKPYLKFGHDQNQNMIQKDGLPSIGWVHGVRKVGDKLVANFKDIPEKVYTLLRNKAYKRVSAELFWNLKESGKVYRRALKSVALLGADTPALTGLSDIINLYTENDYECIKLCTVWEENRMDENILKQYKLENDELQTKIKQFEMEINEQKKFVSERDERIKKFEAEKQEFFTRSVDAYLEESIKAEKIFPAQKEHLKTLCRTESDFESVKNFILNQKPAANFVEQTQHVEIDKSGDNKNEITDNEVREYMEKHKVKYADAFTAIAYEKGGK